MCTHCFTYYIILSMHWFFLSVVCFASIDYVSTCNESVSDNSILVQLTVTVIVCSFLRRWSECPADAFSRDFEPLFNIPVMQDDVFLSLISISPDKQEKCKTIIMGLYTKFMEVMENQVADFMPTDKYHAIQDVAIWHKLAHCKLTNLFGEGCFGDLDFSLFKCRNVSAHHLSTLNMLNRNKTISSFLASLSEADEQSVFKVSASLASSFGKSTASKNRMP